MPRATLEDTKQSQKPASLAENAVSSSTESRQMPQNAPECPTTDADGEYEARLKPPRELSPRQRSAMMMLFLGHSCTSVAQALGVDRKTLFRWRRSPAFRAAVEERYGMGAPVREEPEPEPYWMREIRRMREAAALEDQDDETGFEDDDDEAEI
jgi:transposase-like protein